MAGALKADWLERAAPVAGLIGPAAIGACSVAAAIAYRGRDDELYFPLNHFVSELGELDVSALAVLFNSGLIVGGLCFATFMVGFGRMRGGLGGTAYGVLGALAGIAGAAVGVFPMNAIRAHTIAASAFFDLAWIAVALASVDLLVRPDGRFQARLAAARVRCRGGGHRVHLGLRVRGSGARQRAPAAAGPPVGRRDLDPRMGGAHRRHRVDVGRRPGVATGPARGSDVKSRKRVCHGGARCRSIHGRAAPPAHDARARPCLPGAAADRRPGRAGGSRVGPARCGGRRSRRGRARST